MYVLYAICLYVLCSVCGIVREDLGMIVWASADAGMRDFAVIHEQGRRWGWGQLLCVSGQHYPFAQQYYSSA